MSNKVKIKMLVDLDLLKKDKEYIVDSIFVKDGILLYYNIATCDELIFVYPHECKVVGTKGHWKVSWEV